ncbi:FecR family protein [Chitinophaga qingshengii]|uniref:FecR family protein n=1 Tax=Chitinophaga qingshengii TaxID=1569794 RepID=A0ABR7TLB9_9BACT|nr:FecR family protein [Chitinophaga qingshengii]MBC9930282.1 FecR family protein [Chitinophaga qingshengii]
MNTETFREIVDKYLQGTATASEKKIVEAWLQARPEDNEPLQHPNKQAIHAALWQSFTQRTDWSSGTSLLKFHSWMGYAAAAAVLLCCSIWSYNASLKQPSPAVQTITALMGAAKTIQLPDSSIAHLFPGTTLTIPDNFNTQERAIILSGRAFFEVKSNPGKPFYVQSGKLYTRVLGTSFEVTAPDSLHTTVTVSTGKVNVQYDGRPLADLLPGKRLRHNVQQNNFVIDEVNAPLLCEWWKHGMVFNQAPFEEVVQSISDWYNVPITVSATKWQQERVTIRIKDRSLTEALSLLSATIGFQYKKENNRIIIY